MASKIPLPENLVHCLVQYIKNKDHQRIGVMVAIPDPEAKWYRVGWSKCHSYMDSFNKEQALSIAFGRAQANADMSNMPKSLYLSETYHKFMDRCDAYYKVDLPETGTIPENELWIHQNADVLANITNGMAQANEGKVVQRDFHAFVTGEGT